MKIGIATWYSVLNHGALLQAVASKRTLETMGHEVTFVAFNNTNHYEPPKRKKHDFLPWVIIPRKLFSRKKEKIFQLYKSDNIKIEMIESGKWDAVMIGSDEVFSIEGGFIEPLFGIGYNCPVFSYAACAGPSLISDFSASTFKEKFSLSLKKMTSVGVRDENTKLIVKSIAGIDAKLTLDPVLLYGFKDEIKALSPVTRNNICLYAYTFRWDEPNEIKMTKDFAKKHHFKIHSVGFFHDWCDKNINVGPEEILSTISEYSFVLTDTFHGTIFSIITHTPFGVLIRNKSPKLTNLLKLLDLEDRIIDDNNSIDDVMSRNISYDKVDSLIDSLRVESKEFIESTLSNLIFEK